MPYSDLRDWIRQVEDMGQLSVAKGAHWDLEIGAVTEQVDRQWNRPAVIFDEIVGYPPGYRVMVNTLGSTDRVALTWGLPTGLSLMELKEALRPKYQGLQMIKPVEVADGPAMENVMTGEQVDLYKFPTPKWHEHDGGRYIGTGSVDITIDPDEGWVNLGTYRVMILDKNHAAFFASPGRHGGIQRDKYLSRNQPVPVAVSCGHDPSIYVVGATQLPYGVSEYEYAGGIKEQPIEVIKGPVTGLPIPATAELVLEGFVMPGETGVEGPFGEWPGYYGSGSRPEPAIEIRAIYHRNNPIIMGSPPNRPPNESTMHTAFLRSIVIEDQLAKAGVPDVTGVWCHQPGAARLFIVVGIKQRYAGHAKQAGMLASFIHANAYMGRYVIVVDDDIDVTDLNEVIWAMCTRVDPARDIDVIKDCWSGPLDPIIPPGEKGYNSRAVINACRPYHWKDKFPRVVGASPELVKKTVDKWSKLIYGQ